MHGGRIQWFMKELGDLNDLQLRFAGFIGEKSIRLLDPKIQTGKKKDWEKFSAKNTRWLLRDGARFCLLSKWGIPKNTRGIISFVSSLVFFPWETELLHSRSKLNVKMRIKFVFVFSPSKLDRKRFTTYFSPAV